MEMSEALQRELSYNIMIFCDHAKKDPDYKNPDFWSLTRGRLMLVVKDTLMKHYDSGAHTVEEIIVMCLAISPALEKTLSDLRMERKLEHLRKL